MRKLHISLMLLLFIFILTNCELNNQVSNTEPKPKSQKKEVKTTPSLNNVLINPKGNTLQDRIHSPEGFQRSIIPTNTFASYLRNIKLKPSEHQVRYFNGGVKASSEIYMAVIDLEIGKKDLHQCADAVMRLRAEYLWNNKKFDEIHFNFTNGFQVDYTEWKKGRRVIVEGNSTKWNNTIAPSNTYKDFWKYMETIFMYAGTASLEKELAAVEMKEMKIGDVLIQGGHPGHAVIVMDIAEQKDTGKKLFLLAQSYMPAQETQILVNPENETLSPWYELNDAAIINTPEWAFKNSDLKRFN